MENRLCARSLHEIEYSFEATFHRLKPDHYLHSARLKNEIALEQTMWHIRNSVRVLFNRKSIPSDFHLIVLIVLQWNDDLFNPNR